MAQQGPARPTARIEEAIGFVGMFGVLFLGVTVFCEVTGRPALGWALTLLVAVVAVVLLDRWRVRVLRRHAAATGEVHGVGAAPAGPTPKGPAPQGPGPRALAPQRPVSARSADATRPSDAPHLADR